MSTHPNPSPERNPHNQLRHYLGWKEVLRYFFRRKDAQRPSNFNLRMMHGINKTSILVFLGAILFFVFKKLFWEGG